MLPTSCGPPPPGDRIAIGGCGGSGSGKSRLARAVGSALGIAPVHLDTLYYERNWNSLPQDEFAALQRDVATRPRWIIEGTTPPPCRSGCKLPTR